MPIKVRQTLMEKKRWGIAKFHSDQNPFYQQMLDGNLAKSWQDLPILTKNDLQRPLPERLSKNHQTKQVYVGKTSGSSGRPFTFAKDKWSHALSWASFYGHYSRQGIDLDRDLQARFYGMPDQGAARYKERFKDVLSSRYRFPVFDLNPAKMNAVLYQFTKKPFIYCNGYTSSILLFAKYLAERHIVLKDCCPSLKACITTSEMLFKNDRIIIENAFGIPVINEYGASEIGLIAFENSKKELIIDQNLIYVEILDEGGHVLPYGEKGRIVITALHNRAHPFIRYDIGDLGSIALAEAPNDLKIKELSGRSNDIAVLPSGKTVPGLAFYYITKSVIEKTGNVREFVVTQNALNSFTITYVSRRELTSPEIENLKDATSAYLEPGLTIDFNRVEILKRTESGKLRQFRSLL